MVAAKKLLQRILQQMKNERQLVAFALTYNFINKTYNYNGGGGVDCARTFFRRLILHGKKGLEVPNIVTFPN